MKTNHSACTTILVGKEQTENHSMIISRTVDGEMEYEALRFVNVPHAKNQTGMIHAVHNGHFSYPLPKEGLAYSQIYTYGTPETGLSFGECGFNEAGVGISATETIFASKAALAVDPYLPDTGIREDSIPDVVMPRAHSAKEACEILGAVVEEKGSGEGFGVSFVDHDSVWYFENAAGHHWMAQKLPDDAVFISANESRLNVYDPEDTNKFLGSDDLITFAEEHGLYNPKDGPFDFHKAYSEETENDKTYNYTRVWRLQHLVNPSLTTKVEDGPKTPLFVKPVKKLTVDDIKAMQRDHYNGTSHDPYMLKNPKEPWRPVSVMRCDEAHILEVRPELPPAIGQVMYVVLGMPALGLYLPYYAGMDHYRKEYTNGKLYDDNSVSWIYRYPQILAMQDFPRLAPMVQETYSAFEKDVAHRQKVMEHEYLDTYQKDPAKAAQIIQDFEDEIMKGGLEITRALTNRLFIALANRVVEVYPFHGA